MTNEALSCEGLCAGYGKRRVLENVTLTLAPGTLTAVVGVNGSGKSTLLQALSGILPLQEGRVSLCGRGVDSYPPRERGRLLAYLPQLRPPAELTALAVALSGRYPYLSFPRRYGEGDREAAREALRAVGAQGLAHRPVRELSGGERQRVYLASALAQDTPLLLLDEPCTGLDAGAELELLALLKELTRRGKTVLMSHHNLTAVLETADRILVLAAGGLLAEGTAEAAAPAMEAAFGVRLSRVSPSPDAPPLWRVSPGRGA